MSVSWGDVSSYLALIASITALGITFKFNERQKKFFENQELLNKTLLRQVDAENKEKKQADFGARIVKLSQNERRLKIFNQGKAPARNVRIELIEGDEMLMKSDVEEKFPADQIDPQHGIDLHASMFLSGPSKVKFRVLWEDDYSTSQEKVLIAHA
jgi:hypothetical protein